MLAISDLQVARGGRVLFTGASFSLAPGHRLGVTGPNGCGKSSLFRVLMGELEPERGEVTLPAGWQVVQIEQESPQGDLRAVDFVLAADERLARIESRLNAAEKQGDDETLAHLHHEFDLIDGHTAPARAARLLAGLGFSEDDQQRPVDTFSGGWRGRLALARALFRISDVLLLDEPTNHLDLETILWLERWLRRYPGVALIVSHDREFLDRVTTHTAWYEGQTIRCMAGCYSEVEEKRAQQAEQLAAEFRKQQARAKELQQFVDRFRYKASKARQAQSRLKMLERLTASAPAHASDGYRFEFPDADRVSSPLLTLDHVSVGYGGKAVLSDVHFSLLPGDRIGLLGRNGAGKSTLIRLMDGQLAPIDGQRIEGRNLLTGYFAQHQIDQFDFSRTPLELLAEQAPDEREQRLRDFLGGFGFHGDLALEPVAPRSGGEKARLALALLAWQRPNLLILDEPTNHLDLDMRRELAVALQNFNGALVLVSHDRSLLTACCDRFLRVQGGRVEDFDGDVEDYARGVEPAREATATSEAPASRPTNAKAARQQAARERERLKPLRDRVLRFERKMEEAQTAANAAREALADPTLYQDNDRDRITRLQLEAAEAQRHLDELEHAWLEASEELEQASRSDAAL